MIIDSHVHLGAMSGYYNYGNTLESLLSRMDALGIRYAVNSGTLDLTFGEFERSYQNDMRYYEQSEGRVFSYYSFNPFSGPQCLNLMEKYKDRRVFKGIKIHPAWHKAYGDDPRYEAVFAYAAENRLPIMSHTWSISLTNPIQKFSLPSTLTKYASQYPNARLILGHSGGRYDGMLEAMELAKSCPNVYCDCAGDIYLDRYIEVMVAGIGADRVLYGSDFSMMDQRIMLGVVLGADISLADKEKILCRNAAAMFNLPIAGEGV
jgi:hypothetical protein